MTKLVNLMLAVAMIVGAVLAMQADGRRRELQVEYDRLAAKNGYLPIGDPNKIHLIGIPNDDPMHYRWRVYIPGNLPMSWRSKHTSSSSSGYSKPRDFVAQLRLRFDPNDTLQAFYSNGSGSGRSSVVSGDSAKFLREHWDEMNFEIAGQRGVESYDGDTIVDLVRITMPDELFKDYSARFPRRARYTGNVIYMREFGGQAAFDARERQQATGGGS